jgi:hypothetical protein
MADVARVQPSDGNLLVWDSALGKWVPKAPPAPATPISNTPPPDPSVGSRWIDPVTGREAVWYSDRSGNAAWVEFFSEGDFRSLAAATSPLSLPRNPTANQLIVNGRRKWRWDGKAWRSLSPPGLDGLSSPDGTISVSSSPEGTAAISVASVPPSVTLDSLKGLQNSDKSQARQALGLGSAATSSVSDFAPSTHRQPLSSIDGDGAASGQIPMWNGSAWVPVEPPSGGDGDSSVSDGDKGDIVISGGGSVWTIKSGSVDTSRLGGDITDAGKSLLNDPSPSAQRNTLGLGTAATRNIGTGDGQVPVFDSQNRYPAGDGSLLYNISSSILDEFGRYPAGDGSLIYNIDADYLDGYTRQRITRAGWYYEWGDSDGSSYEDPYDNLCERVNFCGSFSIRANTFDGSSVFEVSDADGNTIFKITDDGKVVGNFGFTEISDVPPSPTYRGNRWVDPVTGRESIWYTDASGLSAWVEFGSDGDHMYLSPASTPLQLHPDPELDHVLVHGRRKWRWDGYAWRVLGAPQLDGLVSTDGSIGLSSSGGTVDLSVLFVAPSVTLVSIQNFDQAAQSVARLSLGLGSASVRDIGTGSGDVPAFDSLGRYPSGDGSLIYNVDAAYLDGYTRQRITRAGWYHEWGWSTDPYAGGDGDSGDGNGACENISLCGTFAVRATTFDGSYVFEIRGSDGRRLFGVDDSGNISGSLALTDVSLNPPSSPVSGTRWIDPSTGRESIWYTGAGGAGTWVEFGSEGDFLSLQSTSSPLSLPFSPAPDQLVIHGRRKWRWDGLVWRLQSPPRLEGIASNDGSINVQISPDGSADISVGNIPSDSVLSAIQSFGSTQKSSARDALGLGSAATSAKSEFAPSVHTHTLSAISRSGASAGQVPVWNGTAWVPQIPISPVSDGDRGDIFVSGGGKIWTIEAGAVGTYQLGGDITQAGKNLLDDVNPAAQRLTLGLGTAAVLNVGEGSGNIPVFDSQNRYPAGDGSLLYNISSGFLDEFGRYPAGDGSLIYNVDADYLDGYTRQRITRAGWYHEWGNSDGDSYEDPDSNLCERVSYCGSFSIRANTFDGSSIFEISDAEGNTVFKVTDSGKVVGDFGFTEISSVQPSSPYEGTRWIDPITGRESVWYTDPSGISAWVEFGSEGDNFSLPAASTPLQLQQNPTLDQVIIHGRRKWRWDGTAWRIIGIQTAEGFTSTDGSIGISNTGGAVDLSVVTLPQAVTISSLQSLDEVARSAARSALDLGTASLRNIGSGNGDVPTFDGYGRYPSGDGSLIYNVDAAYLDGYTRQRITRAGWYHEWGWPSGPGLGGDGDSDGGIASDLCENVSFCGTFTVRATTFDGSSVFEIRGSDGSTLFGINDNGYVVGSLSFTNISSNPPASPSLGTRWIDPVSGRESVWYREGNDTGTWVEFGSEGDFFGLSSASTQLSLPPSPVNGQVFAHGRRKWTWDGLVWRLVSPPRLEGLSSNEGSVNIQRSSDGTADLSIIKVSPSVALAAIKSFGSLQKSEARDALGLGSAATSFKSEFAPSVHTHPLSAISRSGASSGQVPVWNGTSWFPQTPPDPVTDGDRGDITVSGGGKIWTIEEGAVGTSRLGGDITQAGKNLLDDASPAAQRLTLELGTVAVRDVGSGDGQIPAFDSQNRYPAGDGSLLYNISSGFLDEFGRYQAGDGSLIYNIDADYLDGYTRERITRAGWYHEWGNIGGDSDGDSSGGSLCERVNFCGSFSIRAETFDGSSVLEVSDTDGNTVFRVNDGGQVFGDFQNVDAVLLDGYTREQITRAGWFHEWGWSGDGLASDFISQECENIRLCGSFAIRSTTLDGSSVFEVKGMDGRTVFRITDQGRVISDAGFDIYCGNFSE